MTAVYRLLRFVFGVLTGACYLAALYAALNGQPGSFWLFGCAFACLVVWDHLHAAQVRARPRRRMVGTGA